MNCHTAVPFCVACPPSAADASGLSVNMIVNELLETNGADFPTVRMLAAHIR